MSILDILNELDATSSRNRKEEILKAHVDNDLLKLVLKTSMDPQYNFYISKTPSERINMGPKTLQEAIDFVLENFATRKITGNAAKVEYAELLGSLSPDDAIVLERIIKRDLRCGTKIATVNKVFGEDYIYTHPVLLCEKFSIESANKLIKKNGRAFIQLKSDGARATISVYEDKVIVHSRNGEVIDCKGRFDWLIPVVPGWVLDGELLIRKDGKIVPRKISNGIINKIFQGTASEEDLDMMIMTSWDMIPLKNFQEKKKTSVIYEDRLAILRSVLANHYGRNIDLIESHMITSMEEADVYVSAWMVSGLEGGVLKTPCMQWEDKRSKDCVKIKAENNADLEIVAWEFGKDGKQFSKSLGALVGETSDNLLQVNAGSGYSWRDRHTFLETDSGRVAYDDANGKTNENSPFWVDNGFGGRSFDEDAYLANLPEANVQEIDDGLIGKIMEVIYNEKITSKGKDKASLFLPRFFLLRRDKDVANTMEELK